MAYLNVKDRVIEAKIVYYGAGLSGKTTNLEQVKALAQGGRCGEMMTLDTDGDRTLFFDWLPFNIGKFNGCDVKMQLYTVPGQARYAETRKRVLAGADGVVLVLDSQSGALEKNKQCVADFKVHLAENGLPANIPVVVQLNKRDLPTAMSAEELMREAGVEGLSFVPAVAAKGEGVFETLKEATRLVLESVREAAKSSAPDLRMGNKSGLDGASMYQTLVDAGQAPALPTPPKEPAAKEQPAAAATMSANGSSQPAASAPAPSLTARPTVTPQDDVASTNGRASAEAAILARRVEAPKVEPKPAPPPARAEAPKAAAPVPLPATPTPSGGTSVAAATQLGEVIAGHRVLSRRIDALETSIAQVFTAALGDLERRLVARSADAIAEKLDKRIAALEGATAAARESLTTLIAGVASTTATKLEELAQATPSAETIDLRISSRITPALEALGGLEKRIRGLETRVAEANPLPQVTAVKESVAALDAHVREAIQAEAAARAVSHAALRDGIDELREQLTTLSSRVESLPHAVDKSVSSSATLTLDEIRKGASRLEGAIDRTAKAAEVAQLQQQKDASNELRALKGALEQATAPLAQKLDAHGKALGEATAPLAQKLDAHGKSIERVSGELAGRLDAQAKGFEHVVKSSEGTGRALEAIAKSADAAAKNAELSARTGERNGASLGRIVESTEQTAASVAAVDAKLGGLGVLITDSRALLEKRFGELLEARVARVDKAVGDVWTHTHNHFQVVDGKMKETLDTLGAIVAEAKKSRGWFR